MSNKRKSKDSCKSNRNTLNTITVIKYEEDVLDAPDSPEPRDLRISDSELETPQPSEVEKNKNSDTIFVCTVEEDGNVNMISEMAVRDKLEPTKINCKFCSKSYKSSVSMRKHQSKCLLNIKKKGIVIPGQMMKLAEVNKPNFSCKLCKKKYFFKKSFSEHMTNEHSKLPNALKCEQCNATCPDKERLEAHIQKVHNGPVFTCPNCPATFSRGYHVSRHIQQRGCNGNTMVKNFRCKICGSLFSRKDNLMYHLRNNHINNIRKFQCKLCEFGAQNFNSLVRHYKKYHMEDIYICDYCDARLGSRMAISKHLETHGEKRFCCGLCNYMSHTIEVMKRHVLVHSKNKPLKCSNCDASFIQVSQLKAHALKHSRTCEICDQEFKSNQALVIHMRKHMGMDKLVCPIENCTMSKREFIDENALHIHMKTHDADELLYECQICKKRFAKDISLRRHFRLHALERPRTCLYCVGARAFGRGDRLLNHMRNKHPDRLALLVARVRGMEGVQLENFKLTPQEIDQILARLDTLQEKAVKENENTKLLEIIKSDETQSSTVTIDSTNSTPDSRIKTKQMESPVMSEQELGESVSALLRQLIDAPTLAALGAHNDDVDLVLQRVIKHCGADPAQGRGWARVQRVRENLKLLFVRVLDDDDVRRMLDRYTVDQVVRHMLSMAVHSQDNDE